MPLAILYVVEAQSRTDLIVIHGTWHVLFICQDQDWHALEFVLLEHDLELLLRELEALAICRVNYEYYCIGVLVVASPVGPQSRLST